jgi:TPR repeat protein
MAAKDQDMTDDTRWFHFPHFRRIPLSGWLAVLLILLSLSALFIYSSAPQYITHNAISLRKSAENGDPESQYELGRFYQQFARDDSERTLVFYWYEKAAQQGFANAQIALAICYYEDSCAPRDMALAVSWFEKAAEQGHYYAQARLGRMYEYGIGIKPDNAKAAYWYEKAALQEYAWAQDNMGNLYEKGKGVPKDDVIARQWYEKAAAQNDAHAATRLGYLYYHGYGGPADILKAGEYLGIAARNGDEYAQGYIERLGKRCHEAGLPRLDDPFPRNIVHDCVISAAAGDAESQYRASLIYERENPYTAVARDAAQSYAFLQKSAAQGFDPAIARLRIKDRP